MSRFDHQRFYCEENVVRLLASPELAHSARFALFVTNPSAAVAVWEQRLGVGDAPVVWDYHVVAVTLAPRLVWDLDTRLPLPRPLDAYLGSSFRALPPDEAELAPAFRLVEFAELRETFASDRRHMRREDGTYLAPPPPWPVVGMGHTLDRFLDLGDPIAGDVAGSVGELVALLQAREP